MRTALALTLFSLAAGCGPDDDPPDPPCSSETVLTQQFPTQGLSAIETLPTLPDQVALDPNPLLIDGDTVGGAGLDVGFGLAQAGDNHLRDMGVQFADATTAVNRIDVYVDDALPQEVVNAFTWTAYRSDDNLGWAIVQKSGSVVFDLFANRFEIPIAVTQARYLKVVTRPLLPSVTTDVAFESVLVTEVQALVETTTCVP